MTLRKREISPIDAVLAMRVDDWRESAACIGTPLSIWFEDEPEEAENYCNKCPVFNKCLDNRTYFDDSIGFRAVSEREFQRIHDHRTRHVIRFRFDTQPVLEAFGETW